LLILISGTILLSGCTMQTEGKVGDDNVGGIGDGSSAAHNPDDRPLDNRTTNPQPETKNQTISSPVPLPIRKTTDVLTADRNFTERVHYNYSNRTTGDGRQIIYYFYLPHCSACMTIKPDVERLKAAYTGIFWIEQDISTPEGRAAYDDFAVQMNLSRDKLYVPQVLVNGTIITGWPDINSSLEGIIKVLVP